MGEHKKHLAKIKGLKFYKFLGTGKKPGFRLSPDFKTYAFLSSWESKEDQSEFYRFHNYFQEFKKKSKSIRFIEIETISCNGLWNNIKPFIPSKNIKKSDLSNNKIAVLTRGAVKFSKSINFWLSIGDASKAISNAKGVSFFKGIGELPLFEQATFSIWNDIDCINKFAYQNKIHSNIIKKSQSQKWYSEDLFARFLIKSDKTLTYKI